MSKKKDLNNQREIACLADTGRQGEPGTRPQGWEKWIPCLQQAGRLMHAGMTGVMLVFAIP